MENSNLPAAFHDDVFGLVKAYVDSHEVDIESVIGAEERIAIDRDGKQVDWDDPTAWFRAILDYLQISGHVAKITDYKTGWAMITNPFQLEIYAWLVKVLYPQVTDFQIEIDYLRHEFQKSITFGDDDVERIGERVASKIRTIEKETEFEPQVSIACSYCPLWYCCPAMKATDIPFKTPTDEGTAVTLALELEKLTRLKAEAQKVLRLWCDKSGALEAGGRLFQFKPSITYDFPDINDLLVKLDEHGVNLLEYVNVDNRKLKTLYSRPEIEQLVKAIGEKKVSVRFSTTKAKSEKKETAAEAE